MHNAIWTIGVSIFVNWIVKLACKRWWLVLHLSRVCTATTWIISTPLPSLEAIIRPSTGQQLLYLPHVRAVTILLYFVGEKNMNIDSIINRALQTTMTEWKELRSFFYCRFIYVLNERQDWHSLQDGFSLRLELDMTGPKNLINWAEFAVILVSFVSPYFMIALESKWGFISLIGRCWGTQHTV